MKRLISTIILALAAFSAAFAQSGVTGVIRDDSGEALAGAYVIVKGTATAVMALPDGSYSIQIPSGVKDPVLVFSYLGCEDKEVAVAGKARINVTLTVTSNDLDEAVVVGFGVQQKASITGSISNVNNDALISTPTSDVTNALSGRIPGLASRQESGRPGGDESELFIRGRSSVNSSAPLVLVDGVERSLSQIPSDDIESVSVLKDASATAVYGVRGANGVILVTTRRGVDGKPKVSFSSEYGITKFNRVLRYLDAATSTRYSREGAASRGDDPSSILQPNVYPATEYDVHLYQTQESPFTHPDNNFVGMFTKPGTQQKYNVNVAGGNKSLKYFVSVGYFHQTGMFQTDIEKLKKEPILARLIEEAPILDEVLQPTDYNSDYLYDRLTARANLDIQLARRLSVKVNLAYIMGAQNRPAGVDNLTNDSENMRLFGMFYRNAPMDYPLMNANGTFSSALGVWRQNPIVNFCYGGFKKIFSSRLQDNIQFNYDLDDLIHGLSITGNFSYDASWGSWWGVIERPDVYAYNPKTGIYERGLAGQLAQRNQGVTAASYNTYGEAAIRYKNSFNGKHNVSAVALATYTSKNVPSSGSTYSYVPHVYKALIGRVNYSYMNKYLLEANAGYNGSNRFKKGHQYQLFPAVSGGWVITEEPFMKGLKNTLSFAKLRSSYGMVGNDNIGSFSYYYLSSYDNGKAYSFGETWQNRTTGLVEGTLANEDISWEISRKFDVGIDTKWLSNRLSFSADYFKEHRTNILYKPANYLGTSGVTGIPAGNIGIIDNEGYELEIGYNDKIGSFRYHLGGNIAYAHNTIIENGEADQPYDYMYSKGGSIGQYRGYHYTGFFQSYEEIAASPTQFGLSNIMPGDVKYADFNGDGIVDQNDITTIGYSLVPEITYAFNLGFNWKGFDLNMLFQGATRSSVRIYGDLGFDNRSGNYFFDHVNRWTPETAATATYPRFYRAANPDYQNYFESDFWLKDSSYLRLKNIQFGYTLPKSFTKKLRMDHVRIYTTGYNLLTWDKVKKVDPESPETEGYIYPQQYVYNFGLNINF